MILGASHIVFGVRDEAAAAAALREIGFAEQFRSPGLPNSPEKGPFLGGRPPAHDLSYHAAAGRPAVELVRYPDESGGGRPYHPLLAPETARRCGARPCPPPPGIDPGALPGAPEPVRIDALQTDAFVQDGLAAPGVGTLLLPSPDPDAALPFWTRGLGFRPEDGGTGFLARPATMPQWRLRLLLTRGGDGGGGRLDAAGCQVVGFLSTDPAADGRALLAHGGTAASRPFVLDVHDKTLTIVLVRGPGGELVELFAPAPRLR